MPAWIHRRAESLKKDMEKTYGPEKAEQVAFAVATQMSHRLGKSPKTFKSKTTGKKERFGTPEGRRTAKAKFDKPKKEYRKTAGEAMDKQAARWREALRLGQLGADDLARLKSSKLLQHAKEVAGLEKGTENLMRRMGTTQILHEAPEGAYDIAKNQIKMPSAQMMSEVPGAGGVTKENVPALAATVRRHEVDEARVGKRMLGRRGLASFPEESEFFSNPQVAGFAGDVGAGRFSSHLSPEVVGREQRNLAMMPESVQGAFQKMRSEHFPENEFVKSLSGVDRSGAMTKGEVARGAKRWGKMSPIEKMELSESVKTAEAAMDTILETNETQTTGGEQPHLDPQTDPASSETNDVAAIVAKANKSPGSQEDLGKLLDNLGDKKTFRREHVVTDPTADKPNTPNIKVANDILWASCFDELQKIAQGGSPISDTIQSLIKGDGQASTPVRLPHQQASS